MLWTCAGLHATEYVLDDRVYANSIKSVTLYPSSSVSSASYQNAVVNIKQSGSLLLQFDELGDEYFSYYVKIFNCDADWKQSTLPDMQFLSLYNEFNITKYNYSINTFEKYIHYSFNVPAVKVSGNYVLIVYRDGNIDDVVLSRRFVVVENLVNINVTMGFGTGSYRYTHQNPDFYIAYPTYDIQNSNQVRVVIRQNGRYDTQKMITTPLYARESEKILDYRFFNNELAFAAGNEYRVFDTRSLQTNRLGVDNIMLDGKDYEATLTPQVPRADKTYLLLPDINGMFTIYKQETADGSYDGDYSWVDFTLKSEMPYEKPVYVFGKLTDWRAQEQYKMTYSDKDKAYKLRTKFKQGYYNYAFGLYDSKKDVMDEAAIEGNFVQTNNIYEIFVYYVPFGSRNEIVIGYKALQMN